MSGIDVRPRCCARIVQNTNFYRTRQCYNYARVRRGGDWYCGLHDPESVKSRRQRVMQKRGDKFAERQKRQRVALHAQGLLHVLHALVNAGRAYRTRQHVEIARTTRLRNLQQIESEAIKLIRRCEGEGNGQDTGRRTRGTADAV